MKRIVITGIGVLTPLGIGKETFWHRLRNGVPGLRSISLFDPAPCLNRLAGEVPDFSPEQFLGSKGLRHFDRTTLLLAAAAKLALEDSGAQGEYEKDEIGIAVGSTFGSISSIADFDTEALREGPSYVNPMQFPNTVLNAPASRVSILLQVRGPNATLSTAETSSLDALGYASDFLKLGRAKGMLAGGTFGLSQNVFWGFSGTNVLSGSTGEEEICAPFDRRRNGVVLGEGSCLLFLEPLSEALARGAKIYGEIAGYGSAFQPRGVEPTRGPQRAIRVALENASLEPREVSCVFSGANSTQIGDKLEVKALHAVFGEGDACPPVSGIKSMCGECLDASGAMQATAAVFAQADQVLPPTVNYEQKDEGCDIDCVPNLCRGADVTHALLTGLSYTGNYSALLISPVGEG